MKMKLLVGTIILGASLSALGQDAVAPRPATPARLATDIVVSGPMKQSPFTADESGETVRVLADGNRIVENWTGKMARNSEGRIRRDITSGKMGEGARPFIFGSATTNGVVALGATGGSNHIMLNKADAEHTVARVALAPAASGGSGQAVTIVSSGSTAAPAEGKIYSLSTTGQGFALGDRAEGVRLAVAAPAEEGKFTTRKEDLGTRDFSGVSAQGVRVTTTFQAGAVGNEREIEVTSETWFSKDLGVLVYSKRTDPRFGETTYQLTNINRAEPDPSLFPTKK